MKYTEYASFNNYKLLEPTSVFSLKSFLRHFKQEDWTNLVWREKFRENISGVGAKKGKLSERTEVRFAWSD